MSVLGLDVGTSTCKGVVLSEDGRILAQNQITYADAVTVRGATAEISANVFEDSAKKVISVLAQATKHDPIAAIAVSSMLVNKVLKEGTFTVTYVLYEDRLEIYTRYGLIEKQTDEVFLAQAQFSDKTIVSGGRIIHFYPDKKLKKLLNI